MISPRSALLAASLCAALPLVQPACAAFEPLRPQAARDLGCPADQLDITQLDDERTSVRGCGKSAMYYCNPDMQSRTHCRREQVLPPTTALQDIASQDLACPGTKVVVDSKDDLHFTAHGCDRQGSYECEKPLSGLRCRRTGPPASAAPSGSSVTSLPPSAPSAHP